MDKSINYFRLNIKTNEILNQNERYIFFKINQYVDSNPKGALGINLLSKIAIAVDKKIYPHYEDYLL